MFLIPTITANLQSSGSIRYAALVIATWCIYSDKGVDRHGKQLEIVDQMKDALHEAANRTGKDKLSFLKFKPVFGNLAQNERFATVYAKMIDAVYQNADVSIHMQTIIEEVVGE